MQEGTLEDLVQDGTPEDLMQEGSPEDSEDVSGSSEFTDVEEKDTQGSSVNSSKQSASAKVNCCVSFPRLPLHTAFAQSHTHGSIADAADNVPTAEVISASENAATTEVSLLKLRTT